MQFKVKDIGEEGLAVDLPVTPAWLAQECAGSEISPAPEGLRFKGQLQASGEDYLLRGHLGGAVTTPCARCLEPATVPVDADVNVIYTHKEGGDDEDALDAPDVLTFEDDVIDLTSEVRDEILLAMPVSALCREDCAGLCAVCGGNRNANPCDCVERQKAETGKFAALGKLKI